MSVIRAVLKSGRFKSALTNSAVKSLCQKQQVISNSQIGNFCSTASVRKTFEPDYLDSEGGVIPTYPTLNVQVKGYDFDILESFQSFVHNVAENMGVDVESAWATPAKTYDVSIFHEGGTRVRDVNNLSHYERNIQMVGLRSIDAPILFDIMRSCLPEGVEMSVHHHLLEHFEDRWIPDPFIDGIRKELMSDEETKAKEIEAKRDIKAGKEAKKQDMLLKTLREDEDD